ncbi:MAG: CRISPR-associated protein Csx16 [Neomegalonema sp.]|nr:CRISPR-associated protein Csx16 [Neomegalonema sp.]
MTDYFVTRHSGAVDWAQRRNIKATLVRDFDVTDVKPGDRVLGTLPVNLAAEVCARGGTYLHLSMDVPFELRGKDLSADDMDACKAELIEYFIERRG